MAGWREEGVRLDSFVELAEMSALINVSGQLMKASVNHFYARESKVARKRPAKMAEGNLVLSISVP